MDIGLPSDEWVAAVVVDDTIELIKHGSPDQKTLLMYEEKWRREGASIQACKVARLLASKYCDMREQHQFELDEAITLVARGMSLAKSTFLVEYTPVIRLEEDEAASATAGKRTDYALVMKGGGIKGLAYIGALELLIQQYDFNWYVGTSAGAVTAVLLGAGFSIDELKEILKSKNFKDFFDARWWQACFNLLAYHGLYPANSFTAWLDTLLAEKLRKPSRVKLSDLPYRVTVYASRRDKPA